MANQQFKLLALLSLCATLLAGGVARGGDEQQAQEFAALIRQLDSTDFETRESTSRRLAELSQRTEARESLALAIEQALLSTDLSFEARSRLQPLARHLPQTRSAADLDASPQRIEQLIQLLTANDAGIRAGAATKLKSLVQSAEASTPMMTLLKARLADSELDSTTRKTLRELLDQARGVWLTSDPQTWQLPPVDVEQIKGWVEVLARPAASGAIKTAEQEVAGQELIDLLARDEYAGIVRDLLAERLNAPGLDVDSIRRLEAVYDWTKPAMVAEYWQGYQHASIQHLLVDVPSVPENALRASHFDRIDDQFAHCVSGNTLAPGNHPVGVFFPHPQQGGAQFHLVNLPTTRRRLAYEFDVKTRDDLTRGREIVERTLERLLEQRQPLSNAMILMLEELDEGQVSAFTGPYLMKVDDSMYPPGEAQFIGNLSRHQNLCHMLARQGRHQAIPGLMAAIAADRFLDSPRETPFVWPWVAVLSITVHDPWDEVDEFLASLIERTDGLMKSQAPRRAEQEPTLLDEDEPIAEAPSTKVPEVGATAAAILLSRHGIPPSVFGVELLSYSPLLSLDCPGSQFRKPEDRQRVLDWWKKHQDQRSQQQKQQS